LPRLLARSASRFAPRLAEALLAQDMPQTPAGEVTEAATGVGSRIASMPDVLRTGAGVASWLALGCLHVLVGRPGVHEADVVTTAQVRRLARANVPVVGEFLRLCRGLALAEIYELQTRQPSPHAAPQTGAI
jgi:hypothetical protein